MTKQEQGKISTFMDLHFVDYVFINPSIKVHDLGYGAKFIPKEFVKGIIGVSKDKFYQLANLDVSIRSTLKLIDCITSIKRNGVIFLGKTKYEDFYLTPDEKVFYYNYKGGVYANKDDEKQNK